MDTEGIIQNNKKVDQPQIRYQIKSELEKHFINIKNQLKILFILRIHPNPLTKLEVTISQYIRPIKAMYWQYKKNKSWKMTWHFLDTTNFVKFKTDPTSRYQKEIKEICKKT